MTILAADSLSVEAADGTALLTDITLRIAPDETIVLCGPPGSGKTVLVKALRGLLDDRDDLSTSGTIRRSDEIGFVFQRPRVQLVRRQVYHDIAFGLENQGLPTEEIHARIEEYADRLDATHLLDRTVRNLSNGEATIVAILGILVTEPAGIILDEPLASLDGHNTTLVLDAIDRLRATDTAVIFAEHDLRDLLTRTDRVVLLDNGRLESAGPPPEVIRDLYTAGVKLPFTTELSLELSTEADNAPIPLTNEELEVNPE